MLEKFRKIFATGVILLGILLSSCGGPAAGGEAHSDMAPLDQMPLEVQQAPVSVQQAYQFAAANPDILSHVGCYCGCGDIGHTSNYACYVSEVDADGTIHYDSHALGCSICVDITLDAQRLHEQGQDVDAIRQYIDRTYSKYGPSNLPK